MQIKINCYINFLLSSSSHSYPAHFDPASLSPPLSVKKHTHLKFQLSQQFVLHSFLVMVYSLHSFQIFAHYNIISHHYLQPHLPSFSVSFFLTSSSSLSVKIKRYLWKFSVHLVPTACSPHLPFPTPWCSSVPHTVNNTQLSLLWISTVIVTVINQGSRWVGQA